MMSRRGLIRTALATFGMSGLPRGAAALAAGELALPAGASEERVDFAAGLDRWTTVAGRWTLEDMAGAPSGRKVLVQRATSNEFNVIVAPFGPFTDVDVAMRFKPMEGTGDASGGIVFRYHEGRYYVVRANALETNLRLYAYDRGRRQLATAGVKAPALGQWHTLRVVAVGDRMQAWLDGTPYLDHRDTRFTAGRVGLWTKADAVTAFDDLVVRAVKGGSG
jgi:hypothetical protein